MKEKSPTEGFVKLTRALLESPAWRSLSINAHRFIDFLMIEHLRHGGQENGSLRAPRRQLWAFGIGQHQVSAAIEETEHVGLVECRRGIGRHSSTYALTWIPYGDKTGPSDRWRAYECQTALATDECQTALSNECQTALTKPVASVKQHSQAPDSCSAKQHSPSRRRSTTTKNMPDGGRGG
jgi:hypothetical protein